MQDESLKYIQIRKDNENTHRSSVTGNIALNPACEDYWIIDDLVSSGKTIEHLLGALRLKFNEEKELREVDVHLNMIAAPRVVGNARVTNRLTTAQFDNKIFIDTWYKV